MKKEELTQRIFELPVFDTHSHLNAPGRSIAAQGFADIGHYFWLSQQLQGVGWKPSASLDLRSAEAYFDAFVKTENTSMNWCMRRILSDVYGITLRSPKDILTADSIIKERAQAQGHVQEVCHKGQIKKVAQNLESQALFPEVPQLGVLVADTLNNAIASFVENPSEDAIAGTVATLASAADAMAQAGHVGCRIDYNLIEALENEAWRNALLNAIFARLHAHGMFVQIFIGMKRRATGSYPEDDAGRITQLYPYFQEYRNCRFEFVCAAEGNSLDVVQAAVMNPNVNPGGLWWYSFRPSMYLQTMQQRLEALAPLKCPILASDATCIEWCYGKTMLVKTLTAEFMSRSVESGWISAECALRTAAAWFYDAPASYYE